MYKKQENYIKYLSVLILCTLIFTIPLLMNPGFIRKDINNNLRSSAVYDPAGIIALWSGPLNTIPAGWKLCDGTGGTINTTNLFVYSTNGTEPAGATGGSTSHNHSYSTIPYHDHGVTNTTSTPHSHTYANPTGSSTSFYLGVVSIYGLGDYGTITVSDSASHTHVVEATGGTNLYMSEEENIPPYYEMAFIEKETDDPTIPIGLIVMWAGNIDSIPAGWELCNGSNGTPDFQDMFIRGAPPGVDPGMLGGTIAHNHTYTEIPTHTHSLASGGSSHSHSGVRGLEVLLEVGVSIYYLSTSGYTEYTNVPHTHTIPQVGQENCTSENTDNLPPYFKVAFIMNMEVTTALPLGVISMWGDSIENIPPGWYQCDGKMNTPNLLNRFPRGVATGEEPGSVGGSATHRHIYTEVPLHTHTVQSDNMRHRHSITTNGGTWTGAWGTGAEIYTSGSGVFSTDISSPSHNHDVNPAGSPTPYTDYANSIPPYIKLIYMQKGLSLSNPSPHNGATDINYNPILSVDVDDLEGDDLNVSFYDASDDGLLGYDIIIGGTGTASVTWSGLSSGTSYSWYVTADDGVNVTHSDTWSFTTNYVPNIPTNPTPNDLATHISFNPTLSVDVFDNDGDDLTVSFYNASDNSLIDADIVLGGTGTASVTWVGLLTGTSYSWYVISDDGLSLTQSATWSFTTNYVPNVPTNPTPNDLATSINYNPTLSVDVSDDEGDDLTVSFYDASDNSLIGSDNILGGNGTASITWAGLLSGTSYSWYAISYDGISTSQSSIWSFTTNYAPTVPTNPTPNDLATGISYNPTLKVDVFDNDGDLLTVSFYDASDDSLIGSVINLGGTGTASITWAGLLSGTSYSWYAISDDGLSVTQSSTWSFTTNYAPNVPTNPTPNDLATGIGYNITLSVDVFDNDGDDLTVSFYDASDDSLIGSDVISGGTGTASVTWAGLLSGTSYSWYAIADDGLSTSQSSTWSFTTAEIPPDYTLIIILSVVGAGAVIGVVSIYAIRRRRRKG